MKIKVTKKHILSGMRGNCTTCPVALALKDAGFKSPYVSPFSVAFGQTDSTFSFPTVVKNFIMAFDGDRYTVEPFEFEMPDEMARFKMQGDSPS